MSAISTDKWFSRADRKLGSQPEALEVPVEVSGAHATTSSAGARELFTESTETTLVFEDGAVVRLAAAIAVGQMLFLKHKASQREIVTRVLRQRSFGPANSYVELEFAEPAPGFWTVTPANPGTPAVKVAAKAAVAPVPSTPVAAQPATPEAADEPEEMYVLMNNAEVNPPPPPVTAPVPDLGLQLSALLDSAPALPQPVPSTKAPNAAAPVLGNELDDLRALFSPQELSAHSPKPSSAAPLPVSTSEEIPESANEQVDENPHSDSQQSSEESTEELAEAEPEGMTSLSEQNLIVIPAMAQGSTSSRIRLLAAVLVLVLLTGAAYTKGLLDPLLGKAGLVSTSSVANGSPVKRPARPWSGILSVPKSAPESTHADGTANAATDASDDANTDQSRSNSSASAKSARSKVADDKSDSSSALVLTSADAPADGSGDAIEPPKLVKSVNAVPPPEAVRNFVTGDVKFDAIVDATGKVSSSTVISGPAPLQAAALDALNHYQYKPATKNGRPTAAHVTVSVKFWYEP